MRLVPHLQWPAAALLLAAAGLGPAHSWLVQGRSAAALQRAGNAPSAQIWVSARAARLACLGFFELAADRYCIAAVQHFGDRRMHRFGYPNLAPLLSLAVALDPRYVTPYVLAGTALSSSGSAHAAQAAVALLEKGCAARPELWRLPFLLGFHLYYVAQDYGRAAAILGRAALLPGAPAHLGPLATRLAAVAGDPQAGIELIDALLASPVAPQARPAYLHRRTLLELELAIAQLEQDVARYRHKTGELPRSCAALQAAGLLRNEGRDPLGGKLWLDALGRVHSAHDGERLRLPQGATAPQTSPSPSPSPSPSLAGPS